MMILSQAAPFDMATTSGIAQSVTLRFVDGAGAAKDICRGALSRPERMLMTFS